MGGGGEGGGGKGKGIDLLENLRRTLLANLECGAPPPVPLLSRTTMNTRPVSRNLITGPNALMYYRQPGSMAQWLR